MRSLATRIGGLALCASAASFVAARGPQRARACDISFPPSVTSGILGFESGTPELSPGSQLPRNLALTYWSTRGEPRLTLAGAAVALEPLGPSPEAGEIGLMTPSEPLQSGALYQLDGSTAFTVADFIDTEPPSAPVLADRSVSVSDGRDGCAYDSCGPMVTVSARIAPGSDDHTPPERLTYALYLGASAQKARQSETPASLGLLENGETWFFAADAWAERDMYLSVAALDFAGNQSTRTEPVLLRRGPSSCSASGSSAFGTLGWALLVLAAHASRRRTKRDPLAAL
jgi:uncharacterized protein (TIGR03382 family)